MATQEQLELALRNAAVKARAGDERAAAAARRFASELKAMRQPAQPKTPAEIEAELQRLVPGVSTNPTDGMTGGQLFWAGAGKSVADTGRGLAQLVGFGPSREQVDATRELEAPLMDTGAGIGGNIAGQVGQAFIPVAGAAKLASYAGRAAPFVRAGIQGAALAGAQNVGTDESRLANTALGGGLGVVGQGAATGAMALAKKALPQREIARSIRAARALDIPLNVSQVTNSGPVRAAQAVTKYLPFSGAASSARAQQEAFNRAVGSTFGADAATLSDDVMRTARRNLSNEFENIYSGKQVEITPDVARRMAAIERNAFEDMTEAEANVVRNQLNKVLSEAQDGVISGKKYQALRTSLQNATDEGKIGRMVKMLRSELDDAAAESLGPDDAARLAKVRSGWANLRTTENALKQVGGAAGNVSPASLWNLIRKGSTKEMRMLAKMGQNTLKDVVSDSGSAQRTMWQNVLTGSSVGGIGATVLGVPLLGLAKLAAAGAVAGRALNSNAASKALQQGKPTAALAKLLKPAPRLLPAASLGGTSAALDIGTVYGYDRDDPRYRGD